MNILVVVDMQNDFIDGALGTPEAVAIVPKVMVKMMNFDGLVMATEIRTVRIIWKHRKEKIFR